MIVRYALRQIRRKPGFSLTVIVTLALGIGANLAVFQLLQAVLFTPLPIASPVATLCSPLRKVSLRWAVVLLLSGVSAPAAGIAAHGTPVIAHSGIGGGVLQAGNGFSEEATLQLVSPDFFAVLGLSPASGRFFAPADDASGQSELPVILRYDFARNKFGSVGSVIGMKATLNRVPIVVIGVAPERFSGVVQGSAPDVWLPLVAQSSGRFGTWFDSLGPGIRCRSRNRRIEIRMEFSGSGSWPAFPMAEKAHRGGPLDASAAAGFADDRQRDQRCQASASTFFTRRCSLCPQQVAKDRWARNTCDPCRS